jgi:hypothetical protein
MENKWPGCPWEAGKQHGANQFSITGQSGGSEAVGLLLVYFSHWEAGSSMTIRASGRC